MWTLRTEIHLRFYVNFILPSASFQQTHLHLIRFYGHIIYRNLSTFEEECKKHEEVCFLRPRV